MTWNCKLECTNDPMLNRIRLNLKVAVTEALKSTSAKDLQIFFSNLRDI